MERPLSGGAKNNGIEEITKNSANKEYIRHRNMRSLSIKYRLKNIIKVAGITFLLSCSSPLVAETLINPDDEEIRMLHAHLAGYHPNFQNYVESSELVRGADEFSKQEVVQSELARISNLYEKSGGVKSLIFDVQAAIREWDSEKSAFPISLFSPDTYIAVGGGVVMSNAQEARHWGLTTENARKVAENLPFNRSVNIRVELDNLELSVTNEKMIAGNVAWVKVFDARTGEELGEYVPHQSQKAITSDEFVASASQRIIDRIMVPALNSTWEEVTNWIFERSLHGDWIWTDAPFEERLRENSSPLEHRFRGDSDILFVGFSPREGWRKNSIAAIMGTKISNDDRSLVGRRFDCHTDQVGDLCGFFGFRVEDEVLRLKYISVSFDTLSGDISEVASSVLGEDVGMFNITTDLWMRVSNNTYMTQLYTIGEERVGPHPLWDLRRGMPNGMHANTMIYITSLDRFAPGSTAVSLLIAE